MAQGPRHLSASFVSSGLRKTAQTLTAAEQAQVQANLAVLPSGTQTGLALTTPVIDGVTYSANNVRQPITEVFTVGGAALHLAVLNAVTFPAAALILRCVLDITTVATGACTIDVGYHATTATTSDTLLDGIDANAAIGVFDSMDATLDTGSNAHAQKAASGKFVTIDEKTGDSTGLVAKLYIQYILI